MSVNGQDPRSNVYLLDGTLQNDFTNGPAGSAAGTALGMDGVREFRVEANAYSAEFGRNSGGQINVLTKSGSNDFDGSLFEYHRNDALDARNYFDTGEQAGLPPQSVRRQHRRTAAAQPDVLLPELRGADRATRAHDLDGRAGRQRAARHPADRRGRRQRGGRAVSRRVPARQRTAARAGARGLQLPLRADARPAFRAGPDRSATPGRTGRSSRATPSTTPTSSCRPTIRSFRASSSRATSSSPPSIARSSRPRR